MRPSLAIALIGLCCSVHLAAQVPSGGPSAAGSADLDRVRAALEKYRDPIVALNDGYLSTLVCIEFPAVADDGHGGGHRAGGMGVHLLNPGLIGPQLDGLKPQVLIYEPVGDSLKLAAAEWFVPVQVAAAQPEMFGRKFDGPMEGHAPIMPVSLHHWDLHVWFWKPNPTGMFSATNPDVKCPKRGYTVQGSNTPVGGHH